MFITMFTKFHHLIHINAVWQRARFLLRQLFWRKFHV